MKVSGRPRSFVIARFFLTITLNMSMNGVLMTEQGNTYHYKAYMEMLLNYNREEGPAS